MIWRDVPFVAEENLYAAPVDEGWILFRAFDQHSMKSLRSGSAGESDRESAMMLYRALRAGDEFVGAGLGNVI